ncbi:MAG: B12-binding domain-containing radical SAM protein [Desulfobacteraceae bacterium]|nr:B12-binding domain-containing radical SAM protein [Desulfobacteraceae bacterium]
MTDVDVVLVKPGSQKQLYGELNAFELTAIEPPLWASLLSGYLRGLGYAVELRDAEVEQWSHEESAKKIKEINPLLAVISVSGSNPSASTMNMSGAGNIVQHLKCIAPEIKTLFHGLHSSVLPDRTLREEEADFVCQGEGFYTLPKLIDVLKAGGSNLRIEGLWYRENGEIKSNPRPPVFKNLDKLPMPAWDLLPMKKYRAHNWHCFDNIRDRQPYGVLYTSLGCPFNCTFCCINAIFGKPGIRYRSPQRVVEDIDFLVQNYGIRNIKVIDELFALKESRVVEICDLIIERGYDLNMWAYARVNTVTPKMLAKMKQAGINWVAYGFESGSKRVLQGVNKSYDLSIVKNVVKMTYDAGLHIGANFIFGLPDDDFDSMQETLSLAMEINAEWSNFYTTMAYPGSKLYEDALESGLPLPETWQSYSQYSYESLPLPTKYLPSGEVLSFRDYAFDAYFKNPRYLDKINRLFGIEAVRHIQEMTQHKLKRRHAQF